ncbi:MAG TPA: Ig-like domain repeat protein, partial [Burkholderiales bacterium]|nr:Ig-like domain repeat protein [Burkholderiales bacterium]
MSRVQRTCRFLIAIGVAFAALFCTAAIAGAPRPDHVVIVVLQERSASTVYGNSAMPYLNSLAANGAKMTNARFSQTPYHTWNPGLPARPAQPNVLYLLSGNEQGVLPSWFQDSSSPYMGSATYAQDGTPLSQPTPNTAVGIGDNLIPASRRPFVTPNLGAAIIAAGRTFASFSESLPYPHYDGTQDPDGTSDNYRRRHNASINWINLTGNSVPSDKTRFVLPVGSNLAFTPTLDPIDTQKYRGFAKDGDGNALDFSALPAVSIVIPNEQNGGHSSSDAAIDAWLQTNIKPYADWAKANNSLLIITFDQDGATDSSHGDPNVTGIDRIATVFYGEKIVAGVYDEPIDHLNVLSTVLDLHGALDTFKQDFSAAYGTTPEAVRQSANLRAIVDVFGAGPALTALQEPPYTTSTSLSSSENPATAGNSVTFTASVSGSSPTGNVNFTDSGTALSGCSNQALTGSGNTRTATCNISTLGVGVHSIVADYVGDAANGASTSSALSQVIKSAQVSTTTTLASSLNPATAGTTVTFTATVTGTAPTGNVTFTDGGNTISACNTVALAGSGNTRTATCSTSSLAVGTHSIVASYGGDATNAGSTSSTLSQVINSAQTTTTTTLASSANPAVLGSTVTFTATVNGSNPTGNVSFSDDSNAIASCNAVALTGSGNNRAAACSINTLGLGTHNITASYAGDSANTASSSSALAQVINPATSSTSLASSSNPASVGSSITFTAMVTGYAPTGTVRFSDGGVVIAGCDAVSVSGTGNTASAPCSSNQFSDGTHSIVATYSGDGNNSVSSSTTLAQVIDHGGSSNVALGNAGAGATASTTATGFPANGASDGDHLGNNWGNGGTWQGSSNSLPDWLQIDFAGLKTIQEIDVYSIQDDYNAPVSPTDKMTFTQYGVSAFQVQYWDGTAWVTVPGGTVSNNDKVWRRFTFQDITTDRIRIYITAIAGSSAQLAEVEAWARNAATVSTTTLSSSLNPATAGTTVTFTATVTGTAPSGNVSFSDGGNAIIGCDAQALSGTGNSRTATCSTNSLAAGTHNLTASYGGDANNASSTSSTLSQIINNAQTATTTTLASSANPATVGTTVTFTATVDGSNPTGTVSFTDGSNAIASCNAVSLSGTGNTRTVTCSTSSLAAGAHNITATYGGDTDNASSTSQALSQVINALTSTTTTLASSANPATVGTTVTFTATVTGAAPSGNVSFKDGSNVITGCDAQALSGTSNSRTASCNTSSLAVGSHTIVASYGGDANNASSTSSTLSQVVNNAQTATTTTLASSANPAGLSTAVTFTATVAGTAPTGNVSFSDGNTVISSCNAMAVSGSGNSRTAVCAISTLAVGTHDITASYSGDSANTASTSAALQQVINAASSTTALTSSANPTSVGSTITLTATVGGYAPTGTVSFSDGGSTISGCGAVNVTASGNTVSATCSTNEFSDGSHNIVASYSGDANNAASNSTALTQVIDHDGSSNVAQASAGAVASSSTTTTDFPASGANDGDHLGRNWGNGGTWQGSSNSLPDWLQITFPGLKTVQEIDVYSIQDSYNAPLVPIASMTFTQYGLSAFQVQYWDGTAWLTVPGGTVSNNDKVWRRFTFDDITTDRIRIYITASAGSSAQLAEVEAWARNAATVSTTALTSSLNPATAGTTVTFTATVTGTAPTGNVTFTDGGNAISACNTVALTDSGDSRTATCSTSGLAVGTHSIVASYGGDTNNASSTSSTLSQVINNAQTTTTTLASSANPATVGTTVTFTATVNGSNPTGSVSFMDGSSAIASCNAVSLTGTGNARTVICSTSSLAAGTHNITASYAGDSGNTGSTSSVLSQVINTLTSTSTALASSANPATLGSSVTLTATVTGSAPTGSVSFSDGSNAIASCNAVPLTGSGNNRTASCSINTLGLGTHNITASYAGDSGNTASSSSALSQAINQATSTTTLASSLNPAAAGSAVTFIATVTGYTPTGTISFSDGANAIAGCNAVGLAGTGNSRTATCNVSTLTAGTHSIIASYTGDANNTASMSSALSQFISSVLANLGLETPNLAGSFRYAPAGASWTFSGGTGISGNGTAFTSGNPAAPEGVQVTFFQNAGAISQTAVIAAGQYAISFKAAQRGNYQVGTQALMVQVDGVTVGQYQPPGTSYTSYQTAPFAIAASGNHTVAIVATGSGSDYTAFVDDIRLTALNLRATTTTLATSGTPVNAGSVVAFTATVTGTSPTGTVVFTDNGTPISGCGAVPLNGGTGVCSTTTLIPGNHTIVATYSGDGNNAGSTSQSVTEVINTTSSLANLGFEVPAAGNGFQYQPTNASWTFTGGAGVSGNNTAFTTGNPPAPEGTQVAFFQNTAAMLQGANILAGEYVITLKAAQRGNYQAGAQVIQVEVDGVIVGQFQPPDKTYSTYQTPPFSIAADGGHTIALRAIGSGSDYTAFVDDVKLVQASLLATSTSLGAEMTAGTIGTTITFTANVVPNAASGTVSFYDGATLISDCSISTVASGTAVCRTNSLSVGTHAITAHYLGDGSYSASTSAAVAVTMTALRTNSNPNNQIRFSDAGQAQLRRQQLVNFIWSDGLPTSRLPSATVMGSAVFSQDLAGVTASLVSQVTRLDSDVSGYDFHSVSYLLMPTNTAHANHLVIVHGGHGSYEKRLAFGVSETINALLAQGFAVDVMQMPL